MPVYTATFIFKVKTYDEDFHRLNDKIDEAAKAQDGYLGKNSWIHPEDEEEHAVIYYWESKEAIHQFSNHPKHLEAKQQFDRWYKGYRVFISEMLTLNEKNWTDEPFLEL